MWASVMARSVTRGSGTDRRSPLEAFVRPFAAVAGEDVAHLARSPWLGHAIDDLEDALLRIALPTLLLELQCDRLRGRLRGTDAAERLEDFAAARLRPSEKRAAILAEYPVLARRLAEHAAGWAAAVSRLVSDLDRDRPAIERHFGRLGPVTRVRAGLGDPHAGGRTTCKVDFDSGVGLYHKPRSLAVATSFLELLRALNEWGAEPAFPLRWVLDAGDHGWEASVGAPADLRTAAAHRYYRQQGGYLAVLHLLAGADMHHENVVTAGADAHLVDLEVLLQAPPRRATATTALGRAALDAHRCVLRTGLLPFRMAIGDGSTDVSGIGANGEQRTPVRVGRVADGGTDRMRIVREHGTLAAAAARPGGDSPLEHWSRDLEGGFTATYDLILRHRREVARRLDGFAGCRVRRVMRPTLVYGLLREAMRHPDALRDGHAQDALADRLWAGVDADDPIVRALTELERRELLADDVPLFGLRADEASVAGVDGALPWSGLEEARRRCDALGEDDRERQLSWLRIALLPRGMHSAAVTGGPAAAGRRRNAAVGEVPIGPSGLEREAIAIGDRLLATATCGEDASMTWIAPAPAGTEAWEVSIGDPSLYGGLSGIALFLGALGARTGLARFAEAAEGALATAGTVLGGRPARDASAYLGAGGRTYALAQLAALCDEPRWMADALESCRDLRGAIDADAGLDVLSGVAGTALVLTGLWERTRDPQAAELAQICARRLIATAEPQAEGIGWRVPVAGRALAGLSHGAAGFALALARVHALAPEPTIAHHVAAALHFERSLWDAQRGGWLDLRGDQQPPPLAAPSWCNGASGILVARLGLPAALCDAKVEEDIELAIAQTVEHGLRGSHALCHGVIGDADTLMLAAGRGDRPQLRATAERAAGDAVRERRRQGAWRCGWGQVEVPGLMVGLAGIGYGLLRIAEPAGLPSPLALAECPR